MPVMPVMPVMPKARTSASIANKLLSRKGCPTTNTIGEHGNKGASDTIVAL